MPQQNFLLQFWTDQCQVFLEQLAAVRKQVRKKPVHDIRVVIKKLNSVLALVHSMPGAAEKAFTGSIRKFFKTSGRYRDAEMNLLLLHRITKRESLELIPFEKYLQSLIRITRVNMVCAASIRLEDEILSLTDFVNRHAGNFSNEHLAVIILKQAAETEKQATGLAAEAERNAHEIRKLLKKIFYWLKCCPFQLLYRPQQLKQLERILTALGNWHDYDVLLHTLRLFRKNVLVKNTTEYFSCRKTEQAVSVLLNQWLDEGCKKLDLRSDRS